MWKNIYDSFFQILTIPWNEYLQKYTDCGKLVMDKFYISIYPLSGVLLVVSTLLLCIIYYYWFNLRFGKFYKRKSYFFFMIINSFVIGLISFIVAKSYLAKFNCTVTSQYLNFGVINFTYGAVLFFIVSILIKKWSPMGKKTPF